MKRPSTFILLLSIFVLVLCGTACLFASTNDKKARPEVSFDKINTIYIIKKAIDLQGGVVEIPSGCTLKFSVRGLLFNGTVIGNKTRIKAPSCNLIFEKCQFEGSWDITTIYPQWFGAKGDGHTDCSTALRCISRLLHNTPYCTIKFAKGIYSLSKEVHFDTPCKIEGPKATITTIKDYPDRDAFRFSKSSKSSFEPNNRVTDVCINFKTYSVPIGFYGYNKVNMHDCTVSTYSSSTRGYPHTKFWFAINCTRLYDATFKNIYIDQPVCYKKNQFNSADGLHLMGQCHDIVADHLYGFAGDDFIALNASEMSWGDIYNIEIKNCKMGTKQLPTKNGIRMYSQTYNGCVPVFIKNVKIQKCFINSDNSPAIYISNSAAGVENTSVPRLQLRDLIISDCEFIAPKYQYSCKFHPSVIRMGGVDAINIQIIDTKVKSNSDSLSTFINVLDNTSLKDVDITNCSFSGDNKYAFVQIGDAQTNDIVTENVLLKNPKSDSEVRVSDKGEFSLINSAIYELRADEK